VVNFVPRPKKLTAATFSFFHQKTETRGDAMPSRHSPFNLGNFYCLVDDAAQNKLECLSLQKKISASLINANTSNI
jgi:hypothetical protein